MSRKTITLEKIKQFCGEPIFSRGMEYYNKNMFYNAYQYQDCIGGTCRGSFGKYYKVEVIFESSCCSLIKNIYCSCPTEHYFVCKHVAATLITWYYSPDHFKKKNEIEMILMKKSKKWIVDVILNYIKTDSHLSNHIINIAKAKKST